MILENQRTGTIDLGGWVGLTKRYCKNEVTLRDTSLANLAILVKPTDKLTHMPGIER